MYLSIFHLFFWICIIFFALSFISLFFSPLVKMINAIMLFVKLYYCRLGISVWFPPGIGTLSASGLQWCKSELEKSSSPLNRIMCAYVCVCLVAAPVRAHTSIVLVPLLNEWDYDIKKYLIWISCLWSDIKDRVTNYKLKQKQKRTLIMSIS